MASESRRTSDEHYDQLDRRVGDLERRVGRVEEQMTLNTLELRANTELTRQVHTMAEGVKGDTAEIVVAVQWLHTTKKFIVGSGAVAGAAVAVIGLLKLLGAM